MTICFAMQCLQRSVRKKSTPTWTFFHYIPYWVDFTQFEIENMYNRKDTHGSRERNTSQTSQ